MKTLNESVLILAMILTSTAQARADVSVRLGFNDRPAPRSYYSNWDHRYHRPVPHYRRRVIAPVVIAPAPYYGGYAYPVYTPPPPPPQPAVTGLTGDYGSDIATFNEKLSRLRSVVRRQHEKESIPTPSYNRFMNLLDGIEHDAHAKAFDRGGDLTDQDFADLYRRLDQTNEDIQIALAE